MRALLILLLVPSFALGLAVGATRVVGQPTPSLAQPTALIWADRVFTSGHNLDAWLTSRGSSYQQWAARHPSLAESFPLNAKRALAVTSEHRAGDRSAEPAWWNELLAILLLGSAVTVVLSLLHQRRPGIWRELARETGSLGRRPEHQSHERVATRVRPAVEDSLHALQRGWGAVAPRLSHVGPEAVKHGRSAAAATRPLRRRIRRRHLSRLVFYAASILLAFAIGAAVSGYLS